MSLLTKDKITQIFCLVDDFCKEYSSEIDSHKKLSNCDNKKTRNRKHLMSDSEIITILMLYHFGTFKNFKHFYLFYVGIHLQSEFPKQLSYSRFISIEHKVFTPMMLFLNIVCFGKCTGISFVDSTKISVCHNKRIFNHKTFDGFAKRGKSTMGWFYGFKLHFVCNEKGEILSFYFLQEILMIVTHEFLKCLKRNSSVNFMLTKDIFHKTCLKCYSIKEYILLLD